VLSWFGLYPVRCMECGGRRLRHVRHRSSEDALAGHAPPG